MSGEAAREAFYDALLEDDAEQLYERAPCGYLSTTPDGTIVKVNQTFLTWTGYQREQLVRRRTFVELLTPGGRIYHETHYAPMLEMSSSVRELALDMVTARGTRLPVLVNAVVERDQAGRSRVVRVAVFDARERREYERELLRAKRRAEESEARARELARTLQQTLIPPTAPQIPGLEVASAYRPAGEGEEVGGDFYDVFQLGPDDWAVAIGDVRGKGVEAAVVTALVRHTLRGLVVQLQSPAEALAALNEVVLTYNPDRFCSVALVRLRRAGDRWTATLGLGGHPQPLLALAEEPARPWGTPGSLVGALEEAEYHDTEVVLASGDVLVLYTDGVTEGRQGRGFYGDERLEARLSVPAASAADLVRDTLADVLDYQGGMPRDDIALVAVRVPPCDTA